MTDELPDYRELDDEKRKLGRIGKEQETEPVASNCAVTDRKIPIRGLIMLFN